MQDNTNLIKNNPESNIKYADQPRKITKQLGRPKGSTTKVIKKREFLKVLSVEERLKILAAIAQDSQTRASERINAIKLITEILNDKVPEQVIEDNDERTKKIILEFANHIKNEDNKIINGNKEQQEQIRKEVNHKEEVKELRSINKEVEAKGILSDIKNENGEDKIKLNFYTNREILDKVEDKDGKFLDALEDEGF